MTSYILRRLLLMIPTLFGIILLNFMIVQAAPGGPVEQMIAKAQGIRNFSKAHELKSKFRTEVEELK